MSLGAGQFSAARRSCGFNQVGFIAGCLFALFTAPVDAQPNSDSITLSVVVNGALPGFRPGDSVSYVTQEMAGVGLSGWEFVPGQAVASANRLEFEITPDPFADSNVRKFFPMPQVNALFGNRHRISVEARLYIGGQYQTLVFDQATVQGGAADPDLAAFFVKIAANLLGPRGAYHAVEFDPPAPLPAP
jgi:hypothetical protein